MIFTNSKSKATHIPNFTAINKFNTLIKKYSVFRKIMQNLWIWQHPNYPNFSFNKSVIDTLANKLEQDHEILKEITSNISRNDLLKAQINAIEDGIFYSSLIVGERLKRSSIRSSIKKRLDENFD